MPTYDYKCTCGKKFEAYNTVDDRKISICPKCSGIAKLVFSFCNNIQIFKEYWDEHITGDPIYITGKKQKQALLKQNNLEQM